MATTHSGGNIHAVSLVGLGSRRVREEVIIQWVNESGDLSCGNIERKAQSWALCAQKMLTERKVERLLTAYGQCLSRE
jgi:hypothetical protein